jgi:hypothetical protein
MPRLKAIAISTGLANEMWLRCPEFEVEIAESENFQLNYLPTSF